MYFIFQDVEFSADCVTIFLQGIQHTLLENQPSLILVSGGAECIMLNKKFYKEHIDPNMMQKLKQQV